LQWKAVFACFCGRQCPVVLFFFFFFFFFLAPSPNDFYRRDSFSSPLWPQALHTSLSPLLMIIGPTRRGFLDHFSPFFFPFCRAAPQNYILYCFSCSLDTNPFPFRKPPSAHLVSVCRRGSLAGASVTQVFLSFFFELSRFFLSYHPLGPFFYPPCGPPVPVILFLFFLHPQFVLCLLVPTLGWRPPSPLCPYFLFPYLPRFPFLLDNLCPVTYLTPPPWERPPPLRPLPI